MWQANLKIIDNVNNINKNIIYKFYKVTTYSQLFRDLPMIYPYNSKNKVIFIFNYLESSTVIDDLSKYILNKDEIIVKINSCKPLYYLYDPIFKDEIAQSYNIKLLYKYYYKKLSHEEEILLYKRIGYKNKLVDVLSSPVYYKNRCIDRLISKYNY